jgi:hypothetical protein
MAWLSGFSKRLKITIPSDNIGSTLTDFPVLLKLTDDCGLTGFDASIVFDELQADANRFKIAVTASDGTTQRYVEIEKWDDSSEEAWLWIKVPSVSSTGKTELYFYYDLAASDNTTYVGDIGDAAAQNVWSNGFWAVFHMGDTSSPFVNSLTTSGTNLSVTGSPTYGTSAKVAEGVDWGSGQTAGQGTTGFTATTVTVESWVKQDSAATAIRRWVTLSSEIAVIRQDTGGTGQFKWYIKTDNVIRSMTVNNQVDTDWGYFAGTWDATTMRMYKDGSEIGTPVVPGGTLNTGAGMSINSASENFEGLQDEIRVSTTARTESWLKATYYTCNDNLLYMEESVAYPQWLGTWGQRIKLTIDEDKVDENLTNFPILVKISDSSGITGKNLRAFFNELTLSSGVHNHSDYDDDFTGTNGDPPDPDKWTETDSTNSMDIQSNKLHFDGEGAGNYTSYVASRFKFDGNSAFDLQIDFDLLTWTSPSSNDNYVRFDVRNGSQYTWMARQQGTGGATNRMRLYGSGGTNDSAWNWTGTTGKFRFTWDGSTLKAFVWTGSQWEWNGNPAGYSCSETYNGDEVYVFLLFEQEATGGDVEATFDNFQINSGHVIYTVNRKKVAFTTSNGTTQCYAEVDDFNVADEEVFYWVKVPIISSSEDTILYLYYDIDQSDNSSYIGDVGEAAAINVWDSNFVSVFHMAQKPTGSASDIKDSKNSNDGTSANMGGGDLTDSKIGKSLDFPDSNDWINLGDINALDGLTEITVEAVAKHEYATLPISTAGHLTRKEQGHAFGGWTPRKARFYVYLSDHGVPGWYNSGDSTTNVDDAAYHYIAGRYDGVDISIFVDGTEESSTTQTNYTTGSTAYDVTIGLMQEEPSKALVQYWKGDIDEVRFSNIGRSDAWISATYETIWDNFITYSTPEDTELFIFQGTVKVQGIPASRKVFLYRRDTGELVRAVTSGGDGLFEAGSPYWDYHFFVILPELTETYDLIANDKIHPEN